MPPILRRAAMVRRHAVKPDHHVLHIQQTQQTQPRMVQKVRDRSIFTQTRFYASDRIKPERIYKLTAPLKPTSTVMPPEKIIVVPENELPQGRPDDNFWGIGALSFPVKTEPEDDYDTHRALDVKSFLPGDEPPKKLFRNSYDIRAYKYLWTLDQKGLNICREMKKCASSRGIVLHSKISPMAVAGGEAWFSQEEDAIYINFCSSRYPLKDESAIPKLAKLWLQFFKKVYVVEPPERYGTITPTLFERAEVQAL